MAKTIARLALTAASYAAAYQAWLLPQGSATELWMACVSGLIIFSLLLDLFVSALPTDL